jgi:hypothetical protein
MILNRTKEILNLEKENGLIKTLESGSFRKRISTTSLYAYLSQTTT